MLFSDCFCEAFGLDTDPNITQDQKVVESSFLFQNIYICKTKNYSDFELSLQIKDLEK